MSAHTPGPWKIDANEGDNILVYAGEGKCLIANVDTENCDLRETALADARLIAAAPALLEALEKAARRLDDAADLMVDSEDATVTHEMAAEARAAITQAKGELYA